MLCPASDYVSSRVAFARREDLTPRNCDGPTWFETVRRGKSFARGSTSRPENDAAKNKQFAAFFDPPEN
jgi:hypothetical protein